MCSDILSTLKILHYSGNHKNFNFDKYCTAHVEQHNRHAALANYGVTPLEETMKIHYFEDRISDSSFASVKSTIMVDCQKFYELDAVMQLYVNFKRSQKAEAPTHQKAAMSLPSKVAEVADKAVGDAVVADEVDPMPVH
jgi:hypothetical protein